MTTPLATLERGIKRGEVGEVRDVSLCNSPLSRLCRQLPLSGSQDKLPLATLERGIQRGEVQIQIFLQFFFISPIIDRF